MDKSEIEKRAWAWIGTPEGEAAYDNGNQGQLDSYTAGAIEISNAQIDEVYFRLSDYMAFGHIEITTEKMKEILESLKIH